MWKSKDDCCHVLPPKHQSSWPVSHHHNEYILGARDYMGISGSLLILPSTWASLLSPQNLETMPSPYSQFGLVGRPPFQPQFPQWSKKENLHRDLCRRSQLEHLQKEVPTVRVEGCHLRGKIRSSKTKRLYTLGIRECSGRGKSVPPRMEVKGGKPWRSSATDSNGNPNQGGKTFLCLQQRPGPPQCPTQSWGECQTSLSSQGLLCPMSALSTLWYLAMAPKSVSFSESARQEKSNGLLPHFQ
eukprot:XP_017170378.1 PREDICTED: uncharacterized protein Gm12223 isoform X2 [Mus musculus]